MKIKTQAVTYMWVNGLTAKLMVMESTVTQMKRLTKVTGLLTDSMAKDWRHGQMVLTTKDHTSQARSMGSQVCLCGLITQSTKANSETITSKVSALTHGQMPALTLETGETIRCMVKVCSHGQNAGRFTMVNIAMIRSTDMGR